MTEDPQPSINQLNIDLVEKGKEKKISALHFVLLGLPIWIYPGILFALAMGLGSIQNIENDKYLPLLGIIITSFFVTALLYPLVYIFCLISFLIVKNEKKKLLFVKIPYFCIITCVLLFLLWGVSEPFLLK